MAPAYPPRGGGAGPGGPACARGSSPSLSEGTSAKWAGGSGTTTALDDSSELLVELLELSEAAGSPGPASIGPAARAFVPKQNI